jgi:hypothetical protein
VDISAKPVPPPVGMIFNILPEASVQIASLFGNFMQTAVRTYFASRPNVILRVAYV